MTERKTLNQKGRQDDRNCPELGCIIGLWTVGLICLLNERYLCFPQSAHGDALSSLADMAAVASTSPTDDINAPRELKLIPKHLAASLPQLTPNLSGPRRSHWCRRDDRDLNETSGSGEFYIVMPQTISMPHTEATAQSPSRRGRCLQTMIIGRPRKRKTQSVKSDSSSTSTRPSLSSSRRGGRH